MLADARECEQNRVRSSSDATAGGVRLARLVNVFRMGKRRLRTEDGVIVRSGRVRLTRHSGQASDRYCLGDSRRLRRCERLHRLCPRSGGTEYSTASPAPSPAKPSAGVLPRIARPAPVPRPADCALVPFAVIRNVKWNPGIRDGWSCGVSSGNRYVTSTCAD